MLYDIGLRILYDYAGPVAGGRHVARLVPVDLPGEQRLVAGRLDIEPEPDERWHGTDFFGNPTVEFAFRAAHEDVTLKVTARVERFAPPARDDASPGLAVLAAEIAGWRGLGAQAPVHFTSPSARVPVHPEFTAYARSATQGAATTRAAVIALGEALHRDMKYDAEATEVDTPTLDAFRLRHGVCQDFSHVMIACLRALGVPAGYVSGFLRTIPPPGKPRLEGADAMHAWVRAWCGADMGWVEYDPTNAALARADHIVVARGRDYADVVPVKGILRGGGGHTSEHAVDVKPIER